MSFSEQLFEQIKDFSSPKEISWIESKVNGNLQSLQTAFVATPRFVSKTPIQSTDIINDVSINNWSLDRLVRVYLLSLLDSTDKDIYTKTLDTLFETAENNEAVALISALPFFAYPDYWLLRATDAVRSNIGLVFDAIAFQNPYPMQNFSELAWNQLVLKCIFNDKPIHRIQGLNVRANQELANSISYLAHERWAAGRTIPAQAWRLVSRFMNETIFKDICTLFVSQKPNDSIAAVLVCSETDFLPAKEELKKYHELNSKAFSWQMLEA
ncbi:EboA domain-containing protein [Emticicia sp. SJ17W-69]|uniref:EboA domain-containing protein n=1 Tax=Emticicia sp. SJ17W-69 TaxID=3421657 RepID=UPI003EB8E1B7